MFRLLKSVLALPYVSMALYESLSRAKSLSLYLSHAHCVKLAWRSGVFCIVEFPRNAFQGHGTQLRHYER